MNDCGPVAAARTMASKWYFYEEQAGGWRWDHVAGTGELIAQAQTLFESRTACVSNAKAHGYAGVADALEKQGLAHARP